MALNAATAALTGSAAFAATPPAGPVAACQNGVCVVNQRGIDSDGDGFSDADEILAGTDPFNSRSFPRIFDLVGLWTKGVVVGAENPFREVIVLPEKGPNGSVIVGNSISALPGRKDVMTRLGLVDPMLKSIDSSNGLKSVLSLPGFIGGSTKNDAPPIRTNGMNLNEISSLDGKTTTTPDGERTDWTDTQTGESAGYDETKRNADGSTTYTSCKSTGECSSSTAPPPKPSAYINP